MCPPGHASSRDPFTGRHTGRPLQIPLQHPLTPQKRTGTEPRPYRSIAVPSSGPMWASAPTKGEESHIGNPGQRRRAERLRRGWEEGVGIVAEIIPKYPATSDNPSVALRATAPFAQGSLALRGTGERADTRVRPYVVIGIASSARRGGTEPAPTGAPGVPVCGPMYRRHGLRRPNFVPKFGASVIGIGPYERTGIRISSSPAGPQPPIPCDSGMVSSKGRASALPLVVSRGAREKFEIPQIFSWGSPLIDSGPLPAGRTAPAGRGISPRPEGDAACQASSGSQSLFSLQKPRGID